MSDTITRAHLETYLDIVDHGSIQAAARVRERSRATCGRYLADLEALFDGAVLVQRAPGQRTITLTPSGEELARRIRTFLHHWDRWLVSTRDALSRARKGVRLGVVVGAFDLLADVLADMRSNDPGLPLHVVEYADDDLLAGVGSGEIDLGFGTLDPQGVPRHLQFHAIGPLPWVVIVPTPIAKSFGPRLRLADLDGRPMVVARSGPARESLEQHFANYEGRPLTFNPACEVNSTPRIVDAVARGFGIAIVSRFRASFPRPGVSIRELVDGPEPLTAGAFTRKGSRLSASARALLQRATTHFHTLDARAAT
ncbi:MAG: LysR family transcriptional regulator [Nannocystaceae bacterium]|nr:LysR family transcriptional regulator [Myxococcales bacterium]